MARVMYPFWQYDFVPALNTLRLAVGMEPCCPHVRPLDNKSYVAMFESVASLVTPPPAAGR